MLVDELAHTNAPGSRHPKRYLDVEELLGAGIDVYTTLNIQHVESLNDIVAGITRIRVRETVPNSIIDRADDIELIDLTPADLIQRLKDGKIYLPRQAERAINHYFSVGNLTALRELALRRTAQRLGGETSTIPSTDAAASLVEYARVNNFTHIVVATSGRARDILSAYRVRGADRQRAGTGRLPAACRPEAR